jgi:hypothetical protein
MWVCPMQNLNLLRRHLTPEQRAEVVVRLRQEGWSGRRIGDKLQVDPSTVLRDLSPVAYATPDLPQRSIGKDGKSYPASRVPSVLDVSARFCYSLRPTIRTPRHRDRDRESRH